MTAPQLSPTSPAPPDLRPGVRRRVQFSARPAQMRLLRQAALTAGKSVSAFVAESSCAAAYRLLIDNPDFLLDDPDWEHFLSLLGQPVSEKDTLRHLLQGDG